MTRAPLDTARAAGRASAAPLDLTGGPWVGAFEDDGEPVEEPAGWWAMLMLGALAWAAFFYALLGWGDWFAGLVWAVVS